MPYYFLNNHTISFSHITFSFPDKKTGHSSWDEMLGTYGFTLSCLLEFPIISNEDAFVTSKSFSSLSKFVCPVWNYCSWILDGRSLDKSNVSLHPSIEIAGLLLQYRQYEAAEVTNQFKILILHFLSFSFANPSFTIFFVISIVEPACYY